LTGAPLASPASEQPPIVSQTVVGVCDGV
jgi:hypothetical protein